MVQRTKPPSSAVKRAARFLTESFSKGSHPNREFIPERYLGDGNGFTLGSIGMPDLVLTVDACLNVLWLWAWFAPVLGHFYRIPIDSQDAHWGSDYLAAHRNAEKVGQQLIREYNRLLAEAKAAYDENGIKKPTSSER